ncbi:hypothetical protein EQM14_04750 [Caproiciproducens sp. NJN-50]|nr:hypothetical protein EQM14_04750 [Caproiciproducens sp. NJN-50]
MAIENDVSCKNSAKGREIPRRAPQRRRRALTNEEQQWILKTPHRARLSAIIMMFAGLRRGELIPLTWQDIDFDRLTIIVNKSVYAIRNTFFIKEGVKTGIEGRTIQNAHYLFPIDHRQLDRSGQFKNLKNFFAALFLNINIQFIF